MNLLAVVLHVVVVCVKAEAGNEESVAVVRVVDYWDGNAVRGYVGMGFW